MHLTHWQSTIRSLWQQRNGYLVLATGLLILNFIQVLVMIGLVGRWHTIVVPAHVDRPFWIDQSTVSDTYLAEMTEYFATLLLDVTPDDVQFNYAALLRYVEPGGYGALKNQLVANEEKIKSQAIATGFYPVAIKTDRKKFRVIITGDLKTWMGQELTSTVRQSYAVHYRYRQGRLLLQAFQEVTSE